MVLLSDKPAILVTGGVAISGATPVSHLRERVSFLFALIISRLEIHHLCDGVHLKRVTLLTKCFC